jgi:hypothetical protein
MSATQTTNRQFVVWSLKLEAPRSGISLRSTYGSFKMFLSCQTGLPDYVIQAGLTFFIR